MSLGKVLTVLSSSSPPGLLELPPRFLFEDGPCYLPLAIDFFLIALSMVRRVKELRELREFEEKQKFMKERKKLKEMELSDE